MIPTVITQHPQREILQPPAPEMWNQEAMRALWVRWAGRNLPMVRATLRPRCDMLAMNDALAALLGYEVFDVSRMSGAPLSHFLPECGTLTSPELWTAGFLYRTLHWKRSDGAPVGIRMLFLQTTDPETGVVLLLGVGSPAAVSQRAGNASILASAN